MSKRITKNQVEKYKARVDLKKTRTKARNAKNVGREIRKGLVETAAIIAPQARRAYEAQATTNKMILGKVNANTAALDEIKEAMYDQPKTKEPNSTTEVGSEGATANKSGDSYDW